MAFINSEPIVSDIVKRYAELLKQELNIAGVYLYGSYVKGNFSEDSDIDIAVVSSDFTGDLISDMLKLMRIRRRVDNRIEPHPFTIEEFNEHNPFVKEIMKNSIRVA